MAAFDLPPSPHIPLARYRVLSPNAAVRVSPLQLAAGSIGDKWQVHGMGSMDQGSSFMLLDKYFEMGGNFIDTANLYQEEMSEMFIGEWAESRGMRDQLVIATKFTAAYKKASPLHAKINHAGNSLKTMNVSLDESLRKLRTHYSISNTPAWIVACANQYAKDHGKTQFVVYQGQWNVMSRSFERDIIPMARMFGLALAPWDVLAGGHLRSDAEEQRRRETGEMGRSLAGLQWERTENEMKMSKALEKVALEVAGEEEPPSVQAVAIAYILHKYTYVVPIVGGRKVEQLGANVKALELSLSEEQITYLESVFPFDPDFPNWFIGDGSSRGS